MPRNRIRIHKKVNNKSKQAGLVDRSQYPRFYINFADSRRINEKYQLQFSLTSWPHLEQLLLLQGTTEKRKRININGLVMSSTFPHWHMSVRVSNTRCSPAVQGNIINQAHWINNKSSRWALILLSRLTGGGSPEKERDMLRQRTFSDRTTARCHDNAEIEMWVKPFSYFHDHSHIKSTIYG